MAGLRTDAEVLARALEIGAMSVADAVAWSYGVIEREDHPEETRENIVDELIAALREAAPAELRQADLASPESY